MVQINFAHKEIQCKIVYYGPGMSGKTTNLELVHSKAPADTRGELTSIATTGERTLYFDYMPLDLGAIAGIRTKFQLYTVPGQIYYKSTRRLVLQGVDGIVFVADSSAAKLEENRESMRDLEDNLREMGRSMSDMPIVVQYNKRDLPDAMSIADLEKQVNVHELPYFEAVAPNGQGVFPTLKALAALVLDAVNRGGIGGTRAVKPAAAPAVPPAPTEVPVAAAPAFTVAAPLPARAQPALSNFAIAASAPASATAARESATAVATLPAPHRVPRPEAAPVSAPAPQATPAPAARPAYQPTPERYVQVSGLGRPSGGGRFAVVLLLAALIAGAAYFVVTRVL